jgi:hypothetical protein
MKGLAAAVTGWTSFDNIAGVFSLYMCLEICLIIIDYVVYVRMCGINDVFIKAFV